MPSPTARTLKELRDNGYLCQVVEKWNPHSKTRLDLFGFIDILALRPDCALPLAIQCTSGVNVSARVKKIIEHEKYKLVRQFMRVEVWGWRKLKSGWAAKKVIL